MRAQCWCDLRVACTLVSARSLCDTRLHACPQATNKQALLRTAKSKQYFANKKVRWVGRQGSKGLFGTRCSVPCLDVCSFALL
jgi:hypothetical protein